MTEPREELRRWRGERTQRAVAAMVGVTSQAVSLWEAGTRPGNDTIRALDEALGAGGELAAAYGITMGGDNDPSTADILREVLRRLDALEHRLAPGPPRAAR